MKIVRSLYVLIMIVLALRTTINAVAGKELPRLFRNEFMNRNPLLTSIQILEFKPVSTQKRSDFVYLVRAIRPDNKFEGKFDDEQFGVFLVARNRDRILKTLDIFATPRWNDYEIKLREVSVSKAIISGRGMTYGDQPMTKSYDLAGTR